MYKVTRRIAARRLTCCSSQSFFGHAPFSSTAKSYSVPNPPLHLDPSLRSLLHDIDISLKNAKKSSGEPKELEIVSGDESGVVHRFPPEQWSPMETNDWIHEETERESRKSPAAEFGSDQIGAVVLPQELCSAINSVISDGQKSLLHSDAKRLFLTSDSKRGEAAEWYAHYDTAYRTRKQAERHATRDGTAFASVVLPAHYSAITSVLRHVKLRLGPLWDVDRIIDWGTGTGSGLWASIYAFQENHSQSGQDELDHSAATSKIKSYLGIDKRDGLVTIGKRLKNIILTENLEVRWQKSFKESDKLLEIEASKTIALSAFFLTTLPTAVAQKTLVEGIWASGAHTLVLIDHDTPEGFKAIAHAREHLLELSKSEAENPEFASSQPAGCHVVAPCPHDKSCPLLHSGGTPLICGFLQRLQRPAFVQRTKHCGTGHEDVHYSYVVIRRGPRPDPSTTGVGRIGAVGRRVLEKGRQEVSMKQLEIHVEGESKPNIEILERLLPEVRVETGLKGEELRDRLRREAYQWPRLVFPPLKKSGHIILDACTAEGKIMRLTIPKSQGKQPFYDARKSSWGDIFPHPPKNAPQVRCQPKVQQKGVPRSGDDIGKRKELHNRRERADYDNLTGLLREREKLSRKDFIRLRGDKVWNEVS